MKKKFMMFAAAILTLAACGNKQAEANANGAEGEATSEVAAEVKGTTYETDFYSVVVPEGWIDKTQGANNIHMAKDVEGGRNLFLDVNNFGTDDRTVEQWAKQQLGSDNYSAEPDLNAAGKTWKVVKMTNTSDEKRNIYYAATDLPTKGFILVTSYNGFNVTEPDVKAVIETIKMK